MNRRIGVYAIFGISIVVFGLLFATLPSERILLQKEYQSLEVYPTYYYTDFTLASSELNPELSLDLAYDPGDNYSNCLTIFALYNLSLEQFEESFNSTLVKETMVGENWSKSDFGAFWAGWFAGTRSYPFGGEAIPSGEYVFVFWIEPDDPIAGWNATFTVSLSTRLLRFY